jgi:hypothetical protein
VLRETGLLLLGIYKHYFLKRYIAKCSVIALLCFVSVFSVTAQDQDKIFVNARHRTGFITGFGGHACLNVSYDYRVIFFQAQYYYALFPKITWGIDILAQPQYNRTRFRYISTDIDETKGYEFGINAGLVIRKNLFDDLLSLYSLFSAGPHYVSGVPERQAPGFIFSDNIFLGINIRLSGNTYLDLRAGYRHISNASLKEINDGVDNTVLSGGLLFNLK